MCTGHWVSGVSWRIGLQALKSTVAQMRGAVFGVVAIPEQGVPAQGVAIMWWQSIPEATLRDQTDRMPLRLPRATEGHQPLRRGTQPGAGRIGHADTMAAGCQMPNVRMRKGTGVAT